MKHTLLILALITASIQTFAQSPRIKLNQITKDSVTGSVLISSPTDSGMVYSRDLFISYGADTVLILGGDTLAKTSGIISSVLSDGVTITGNGTLGSELTADTSVLATLRALSDSLALVISSVTADNVTITGDGTVGSPLTVDTATVVASVGRLLDSLVNVRTDLDLKQDQLNGTGFVKATGTTISYDNSTYLTTEVDGSVTNEIQDISTTGAAGNISISSGSTLNLNVDDADASATNEGSLTVGAGTASTSVIISNTSGSTDVTLTAGTNVTLSETGNNITISATGGGTTYNNISETVDTVYISDYLDVDNNTLYVDATNNRVGIGTSSPSYPFDLRASSGFNLVNVESNQNGVHGIVLRNNNSGASARTGITFYNGSGVGDYFGFYINGQNFTGESGWADRFTVLSGSTVSNGLLFFSELGGIQLSADGRNTPDLYVQDATGNVGIGTTSPSVELDVIGDIEYTGTITDVSDERLKINKEPLLDATSKLMLLNPIKYNQLQLENNKLGNTEYGFTAQDVRKVYPEMVRKVSEKDGVDYLGLSYIQLISPIVKAIQEQQAIIESQATEIEQLKTLITELSNRLQILENN